MSLKMKEELGCNEQGLARQASFQLIHEKNAITVEISV